MPKLSKILWSLAILLIVITTIIFSFGIVLVGAVVISLFGLYRHYFPNKRFAKYKTGPKEYKFREVIDVKAEVIDCKIEPRKPDK